MSSGSLLERYIDEPHNTHQHITHQRNKHQFEVAEFLITSDPDGASAREDRSTTLFLSILIIKIITSFYRRVVLSFAPKTMQ